MKMMITLILGLFAAPIWADNLINKDGEEVEQEQEQLETQDNNTAKKRGPAGESEWEGLDLEREDEEFDPSEYEYYEEENYDDTYDKSYGEELLFFNRASQVNGQKLSCEMT